MNWRLLVLLLLTAAFSFGGSFECRSNNDDDDRSDVVVNTP
jgi:hypothetical protein